MQLAIVNNAFVNDTQWLIIMEHVEFRPLGTNFIIETKGLLILATNNQIQV